MEAVTDHDWGNPNPKPLDDISLADIESLCAEAFLLTENIRKLDVQLSELKTERTKIQGHLINILTEHGKKNYRSEFGSVTVSERYSVRIPKEPEAKKQFFDYLRGKGIFEDMVNIPSATLNAYYKDEKKIWEETSKEPFRIPGIGDETPFTKLQMRKD